MPPPEVIHLGPFLSHASADQGVVMRGVYMFGLSGL
jgi:hypothetical protein